MNLIVVGLESTARAMMSKWFNDRSPSPPILSCQFFLFFLAWRFRNSFSCSRLTKEMVFWSRVEEETLSWKAWSVL
jgi:hypothetical protein